MVEIMKMMFLVAFLLLHAESIEGFEFRLVPNNTQGTEGFVEIFYNDSWGLIGDPDFRFSDATASLLCRKFNLRYSLFGYGARNIYPENNTFSHFWLQNLECNGNKQSIDECVKTDEFKRTQYIQYITDEYKYVWRQEYGSKLYCVDYRLMGGLSQNTGMLLAAFNGTEHSMCYQGFDRSAGDVVCKHLRYNGLVDFTEGDTGTIPLFNNTLTCTGNESSLNECTMSNAVIENCTRAVYITCKAVRLTRRYDGYNDEGSVEIFYNGSWGYLYLGREFNVFNDVTAGLLCETFGFRNIGFSSENPLSGANINKNAWSGYLSCNGTEADIMQCEKPSSFRFVPNVWSETDIGPRLYCFDFNITSMRLFSGLNSNEGIVELHIGGRWGSILTQHYTSEYEAGVCQFLGYGGDSEILDSFVTDYLKRTWMRNFFCDKDKMGFTGCLRTRVNSVEFLTVKCEDTDPCQSNPCLNNGTCVDGDRSYTCNCTERWSGINCEIDTNQCQSNPCLNNGTCVDGDRSYTCNCTERWRGINCEIDACLPQPCENNGTCVNKINGFECFCADGYEGYRCQNEVGDQKTLIVVLISTICVLSIVVLATVCCCLRYRREHKKTKSDASNVLNSGKEGLQNTKKVEAVQIELEEGQNNEDVYDGIKENTVADVADYINPVNDVELSSDADCSSPLLTIWKRCC